MLVTKFAVSVIFIREAIRLTAEVMSRVYNISCQRFQWRHRQDLLRGGTKIWKLSWGIYGGLQGRMQQLLVD